MALTGRAVLDYIFGEMRRGPRWMTRHPGDNGLEWLGGVLTEPLEDGAGEPSGEGTGLILALYMALAPLFGPRVLASKFSINATSPKRV